MRKNKSNIIIIVVLLAISAALIAWARLGSDGPLSTWQGSDVACLSGHSDVQHHIHPELQITVDGERQPIPPNTGIEQGCMAEIHTHQAGTRLHVETTSAGRLDQLTLADFFDVWSKPFQRDGYAHTLTVNGEEVSDPSEVTFSDEDIIRIAYTSENGSGGGETVSTTTQKGPNGTTSSESMSGHEHESPTPDHSHE